MKALDMRTKVVMREAQKKVEEEMRQLRASLPKRGTKCCRYCIYFESYGELIKPVGRCYKTQQDIVDKDVLKCDGDFFISVIHQGPPTQAAIDSFKDILEELEKEGV